jgi:hypothetical protein
MPDGAVQVSLNDRPAGREKQLFRDLPSSGPDLADSANQSWGLTI